ncbi:hypothetical protein SFB93_14290 [Kurthia gibsonii]|uniref:hypothetical protein n=1 Tax=Kurthia gibsonii TaxID=33946 RepID=UPI0039836120
MKTCKAYLMNYLQKEYAFEVNEKEIGIETVELEKEELDKRYFTEEEWLSLPASCLITSVNYDNGRDMSTLNCVHQYKILLKNDERIE